MLITSLIRQRDYDGITLSLSLLEMGEIVYYHSIKGAHPTIPHMVNTLTSSIYLSREIKDQWEMWLNESRQLFSNFSSNRVTHWKEEDWKGWITLKTMRSKEGKGRKKTRGLSIVNIILSKLKRTRKSSFAQKMYVLIRSKCAVEEWDKLNQGKERLQKPLEILKRISKCRMGKIYKWI